MSLRQLTLWKIERSGGKAREEGSGDDEKEIIMRVREWDWNCSTEGAQYK